MATKIILKKSSISGNIPTSEQLEVGEVAVNLADQKLYSKKADNTVVEIGGVGALSSFTNISYIDFDTTATVASAEGRLTWNPDDQTLDLGLANGVVNQLGQEIHMYVKAGETISNGDVVYASGAVGNSGAIEVSKYIANNTIEELYVVGIATQDILVGEFGYITVFGKVRGVSTDGSVFGETWTDGTVLYASPSAAGALTSNQPVAPDQDIAIAMVVSAHATNGTLFVRAFSQGYHLGELHDVHVPSPSNNNLLKWNTTNERWEAATVNTTEVSEGTNLYYTTARANSAIDARVTKSFVDALGIDAATLDGIDSTGFALAGHNHDGVYEPADATILKDADIGVTVQAYNANYVVDASYVHTDNNYTTAEKNKLAGIEAGATADQTITAGSGLTGGGTGNVTLSHADTSTQASVNNSNGVVIQDVTLDGYGHVTGLASIDLDGRYYTESEADSRFVNVTGDTMTGDLLLGTNQVDFKTSGSSTVPQILGHRSSVDLDSRVFTDEGGLSYTTFDAAALNNPGGTNNANGLLTMNTHGGSYNHQLAFTNTGHIYHRNRDNSVLSSWDRIFDDSYHPNADKLTTARNIALTGDVTGSVNFDGSANVSITTTIADDSHNHVISNVDGLQTALDGKLNLSGGTMTGRITMPPQQGIVVDWVAGAKNQVFVMKNYENYGMFWKEGSPDTFQISTTGETTDFALEINREGLTRKGFTVWDSGNDGVGSGLDADLLDGQHGSYYTGYTDTAIANLVASAPATLDTLNELAAALGDDPNFATTVTNSIATKVAKSGDTMTGNLSFGDNVKANFGAGSDLQIWHDGTNSWIKDAGTGTLRLQSSSGILLEGVNGDNFLEGVENGAVYISYDGSQKLATTSTGVDVTGTITHDGLVMTSGTSVDQLYTATMTYTAGTGWTDTGIKASALATGSYMVQVYISEATGSLQYQEYYTGVMSWFGADTNAGSYDEIPLHSAGHADNDKAIYLRTIRTTSADPDNMKLQISANYTGVSTTVTFKFRRMI